MIHIATQDWKKVEVAEDSVLQLHNGRLYVSFTEEKPTHKQDGLLITKAMRFHVSKAIWVRTGTGDTAGNSQFVIQEYSKEIAIEF
ncbi:hypothetical protein V6478_003403 [Providencia rettgeri]|uniref:hypothetical protein n=1 Tax=Providencia sp. wls1921 TaxID=2675153 RepID=UPI0012B53861|nr:hypothetical protein [Providencia sp. wls1921]MTC42082.1 hypothetical protein [Providencia sp. wls1921]